MSLALILSMIQLLLILYYVNVCQIVMNDTCSVDSSKSTCISTGYHNLIYYLYIKHSHVTNTHIILIRHTNGYHGTKTQIEWDKTCYVHE